MTVLIKNGKAFIDGMFVETNLLINKDVISDIGKNIKTGDKIIDASGKYIFPGLIDVHVHFRDFGQEYKEDWLSGSKAALSGGITTVLDMPNNKTPITTVERWNAKRRAVSQKSLVNFGLYMAVTNDNIEEINRSDVKIVKLYYGTTTGEIKVDNTELILKKLRKDILIVVHAEDNDVIEMNKQSCDVRNIKYHSLIRDNRAEYTAVNTLIELAESYNRKIHFTHISSKESMLLIKQAKKNGLKITCDTCPHYLFLDDSLYDKIGNKAKVNPGLKSKQDVELLWKFLRQGVIDIIASDHAPHTLKEKSEEYEKCPAGFPGIETTLALMLTAVNQKKITFDQCIRLMTENPAKIYGLKNKGKIKKRYDADIAIIDLKTEDIIKGNNLYSKAKWSPFDGVKIKDRNIMTIVNGNLIFYSGEINTTYKGKEVEFK
jgi:dihydroorotase